MAATREEEISEILAEREASARTPARLLPRRSVTCSRGAWLSVPALVFI